MSAQPPPPPPPPPPRGPGNPAQKFPPPPPPPTRLVLGSRPPIPPPPPASAPPPPPPPAGTAPVPPAPIPAAPPPPPPVAVTVPPAAPPPAPPPAPPRQPLRLAPEPPVEAKKKPAVSGGTSSSRPPFASGSKPPFASTIPPAPPVSPAPPRRPPPVPQPATPPPSPPVKRSSKTGLVVGVLVVLALGAGGFWYFQQRNRAPADTLVRAEVEKVAGPQLKVTHVTSTITPTTSGHANVTYQAEAELGEALYEPTDANAFLRNELKLDIDAWGRTRRILSGKSAPRILELAGLKGTDDTLLRATFLRTATAAGTKFPFSGALHADKGNDGWQVQSDTVTRANGEPRGQPRSAFSGPVIVVDDPADLKKAQALAASQADVPAKIETARQAYLVERRAQQEKIVADLLDTIKPGTVYAGNAINEGGAPVKVFLEFTNVNPKSRQVTAALRNDGGWDEHRPMRGSFVFDADTETLSLTLDASARTAVEGAGPVLSDRETWQLTFQLNGSKLAARDAHRDFNLTRLSTEELDHARQAIDADLAALREATASGKIYRGTVRTRDGSEEQYYLRFYDQHADAGTVSASLEPVAHEGWRRVYRGTIVANRYRSQGAPLHLETSLSNAVKPANKSSPIGLNRDATIALKVANGRVQGDNEDFTYDFAPLSAAETAKLEAAAAEREKVLLAVVKPATGYPGTAVDAKNHTEKVRIRFVRVEDRGASVDAVLESLERPGIYRELHGMLDIGARRVAFTASGKERTQAAKRAGLRLPLFTRTSGDQDLALEISSDGLSGENQAWKFNFPAAGAVALTGDGTGDYPTESGAYVWANSAWQSLPRNDGKISRSVGQALGGFFSAITKQSNSGGESIVFSGNDPAPTVDGRDVLLIYVGNRDASGMTLGPTTRDNNGSRKATANHGELNDRAMGAVERINDSVTEFACTRTLHSGSYALAVGEEFFELNVQ